jgi:hypothetical protein
MITIDILQHSIFAFFIFFSVFPVLHEGKMTDDYAFVRADMCGKKKFNFRVHTRIGEKETF